MTDKNGGYAFPATGVYGVAQKGMTLRDYFAAHSMAAIKCRDVDEPWAIARWAYTIADAMLKEREEKSDD